MRGDRQHLALSMNLTPLIPLLALSFLSVSNAVATAPVPAIAEALDSGALTICTGGSAAWSRVTSPAHDGVDAAVSGSISHNQSTWMETTVTGPGTVRFWWKVSCEEDGDEMAVKLDGVSKAFLFGEVDWVQYSLPVTAGTHTIRWQYDKDISLSEGQDKGWVDQVEFIGSGSPPIINSTTSLAVVPGFPFEYQITALNSPVSYSASPLPDGLTLNSATGLISGAIFTAGTYPITLSGTNPSGTGTAILTVTVSDSYAPIHDALDLPAGTPVMLRTFGSALPWFRQTAVSHDGSDAAQFGYSGIAQPSLIEAVVNGPAIVSYWWKHQPSPDAGGMSFASPTGIYSGSTTVTFSSGTETFDWQLRSSIIPAGHQKLVWNYRFFGPSSSPPSSGWVDEVKVQPIVYPKLTAAGLGTGFQTPPLGAFSHTPVTGGGELRWFATDRCFVREAGNRTPAGTGPVTPGTHGVKSLTIDNQASVFHVVTESVDTNGWSQVTGSLNLRTYLLGTASFDTGGIPVSASIETSPDDLHWTDLVDVVPPKNGAALQTYTSSSNSTYTPFMSAATTLPGGTKFVRLRIRGQASVPGAGTALTGFIVIDDLLLRGTGVQDLDADGDGYRAGEEALFGTSDSNGRSAPSVSIQKLSATTFRLTCPGVPGRTYRLLAASSLTTGPWTAVNTLIANSATVTFDYTPPANASRYFFKVEAQ